MPAGRSRQIAELIARQVAVLDRTQVLERDSTVEARIAELRAACRSAERVLAARSDAEAVRERRDPVPGSTLVALARLRAQRSRT